MAAARVQVSLLLQEKETILKEQNQFRNTQRFYIEEITKAVAEQRKFGSHSLEFQNVQHKITEIMQQMYSRIGTPEDAKRCEREWRERLEDIDKKLKMYQSVHLPPNQVGQWGPPNDAYTNEHIPIHSLNTYENESRSSSACKSVHPFTLSDHHGSLYDDKGMASSSISGEDQLPPNIEAADVLEEVHRRHGRLYHPTQFPFQFSQDSDINGHFASTSNTSLPLSQSTNASNYHRHYRVPPAAHYKRNSPSSGSDNASSSSGHYHRESGPASEASFSSINLSQSTTSSRNGYVYRLPRPSLPNSNPGSATNLFPTHQYQMSKKHSLPHGHKQSMPPTNSRPSSSNSKKGKTESNKPNDKDRDSFSLKLEMIMSMMSALPSSSQSNNDAVKLISALSQSSECCAVLRQQTFMSQLIKTLHSNEKPSKELAEVRGKALITLQNIVESNPHTKQRRCERSVLNALNKIRVHCDLLFEFIDSCNYPESLMRMKIENIQQSCNNLLSVVQALLKYSSSKELYRPAILTFGGIQTMARILICDYELPTGGEGKIIQHSSEILAITITILVNLTYGDRDNKVLLCQIPSFLKALTSHICSFNEQIMSKGAQVLRNISCKATTEIKDSLMKSKVASILMEAIEHAKVETTIQHITSALWNLSAHSIDNRYFICEAKNGIEILVSLLSYNSPSGATVVIENVGGVLRNLSNVISQEAKYRKRFYEVGGLDKLVQHLKSRNKVVLGNATGILWNLSARCPDNQKLLWDLGCVPLLDVLQTSPVRNVAENARGALRNLLAFGQSKGWTTWADHGHRRRPQQMYSKSTITLPSGGSYSNIARDPSGRSSAPSASSLYKSSHSLVQFNHKNTMDKLASKHSASHLNNPQDYSPKSDHFAPRFSRVSSAPQPNDEWMNYRPSKHMNSPQSMKKPVMYHPHGAPSSSQIHPANYKRTNSKTSSSHVMKSPNDHSYPYSQSESYDSEVHSISGASLGLSPQLPSEEVVREGGVTYDELDIEIDDHLDDETTISHFRHHSEAESETSDALSIAEQFLRDRESMRRICNPPTASSPSPSKLSPCVHHHKNPGLVEFSRALGTGSLSLDGTTPKGDGLESISESGDVTSRSHTSSISSSVGQEIRTDI
jgi:adenomatosis polyposis coli protein